MTKCICGSTLPLLVNHLSASAVVTRDDGDDEDYDTNDIISGLQIFQQLNTANNPDNFSAAASLDGFRVAFANGGNATTNAAQAWIALSAEGIPLPVRFTSFSATEKNNAIQLNWVKGQQEKDVVNYTIERSSNGGEFTGNCHSGSYKQ